MWKEIFRFEVLYRLKRPETYFYFLLLFLFSLVGVEFIFQGVELGLMKKNSPLVIAKTMGAITGLCLLIVSMIMGVPVLRDFQYNVASLIYVNPITKLNYLFGRFLGSFVTLLFVFFGLLFGMILGQFMPWADPNEYLPFKWLYYVQPFFWLVVPILFFSASVFFVVGALSKNLMLVYTQGIIIFVLFMLTKAITNETLQAIFDPFSLTSLTLATKEWLIPQRNSYLIPFTGIMLFNKLFWTLIGIMSLIYGYLKFQLHVISKKPSRNEKIKITSISNSIKKISKVSPIFNLSAQGEQLFLNAWFHAKSILKLTSFWAIVFCSFVIILINSVNLGTTHGVDSYPLTYLILEELKEMSAYFFMVILIFYSSEIMWKEKEAKFDLIHDACPVNSFITLASKFLGLQIIYVTLIFALIASGVIFQAMNGFYQFRLDLYLSGFFIEFYPFLSLYTFVALFFQALTGRKFLGIIATLAFLVVNFGIMVFGIDHVLINFGGNTLPPYSEMNGYGHFMFPYLFVKMYWFIGGLLLLILASILMPRGLETKLKERWRSGRFQLGNTLKGISLVLLMGFISIGIHIFYNTNLLNDYWTDSQKNAYRAGYEKTLKQYEYLEQIKLVEVKLEVDIFPADRAYKVEGSYLLVNPYANPIHEIHLQKLIESEVILEEILFDQEVSKTSDFDEYYYTIYKLKNPLECGDTLKMNFRQSSRPIGFESFESDTKVVYNGSFFDNKVLPSFGYQKKYELEDKDIRNTYGLKPRKYKADRDDSQELVNARTGSDSKGILLEAIISTDFRQTAITSGNLIRRWTEQGRNYFHYKTDQPMINFYSFVSAEYDIMEDSYIPSGNISKEPINLEIYYHAGHEYNLDRMMESMKYSLDYYSTHFGPYPFEQIRIMEFPRYRAFAQSFPNAVPFSEALGFVMNVNDELDVDMAFYITAHELAHQWWGIQLEAANVKGRNMILETLSQYSALMVFKEKYGIEKVQQFLDLQKKDYLEGKRKATVQEPPLVLVEGEEHIYYAKGAINMYAFQEKIGSKKVNEALHNFFHDWQSFDNIAKPNRYANTRDLMKYFSAVTPDSLQYIMTDLFESILEE